MIKEQSIKVENDKLKISDFKNCNQLSFLKIDFYSCSFDEDISQQFRQLIKKCSSLQKLKIKLHNYNSYFVDDFNSSNLALCLSKINTLVTLQLNICNIDFFDEDFSSILIGLCKCENLETLKLTFDSCAIEANFMSSEFYKIKNLKYLVLNLGDNFIEDTGAQALGRELSKCQNLQTLKLQLLQNRIGYEGDINLAQQLANCDKLITLKIQLSPQYQFEKKKDFPDTCTNFFRELSKSKNMKHLSVSYFYKGMILQDLIKGLRYLKNLYTIEFEFSLEKLDIIKVSLMKLKYLVNFDNIIE
ncbi:hypothetical protein ABPG74_019785 [Tetrahymena malaccensis]